MTYAFHYSLFNYGAETPAISGYLLNLQFQSNVKMPLEGFCARFPRPGKVGFLGLTKKTVLDSV